MVLSSPSGNTATTPCTAQLPLEKVTAGQEHTSLHAAGHSVFLNENKNQVLSYLR